MKRGIPLGRVRGVPILVGPSWLVVVPVVGVALFAGIDAELGGSWWRAAVALGGTVLLFASVLVHELGHSVAAVHYGVAVERVVVFLFGGYSEMDLESAEPPDQISVSLAGPIASAMLALVTAVAAALVPEWAGMRRTLALLALVNIAVALFNLLPGYPLDGGRMLRAGLMMAGLEPARAYLISARVGVGLGTAVVAGGLWLSVAGEPASLVAVPVGALVVVLAVAAHPAVGGDPPSAP